jgi:hypothetical protein
MEVGSWVLSHPVVEEQLEEYLVPSVFIQPETVVMNSVCSYIAVVCIIWDISDVVGSAGLSELAK